MSHFARDGVRKVSICVGGVSGVGKTTLLREHTRLCTQDMQVTGSAIVKAIIAPSTVHDLDSWASEQRQAVREKSIHELRQRLSQCDGRLLVDGHFTLRNRNTCLLESIFTAEDKSFFQALILINPHPELVLVQRQGDDRNRTPESVCDIAEHMSFELLEGRRLAQEMNVPLLELVEPDLPGRLNILAEFLNGLDPKGMR